MINVEMQWYDERTTRQDSWSSGASRREPKLTEFGRLRLENEPSNLDRGTFATDAGGWAQSVEADVGLVTM